MKSAKTSFVCQECGYDSPAYMGKCPECGAWNSLKEFSTSGGSASGRKISTSIISAKPQTLSEIVYDETKRLGTGYGEVDGVLGGGVVPGSVILLAGDPGVGKSTLLLQIALNIASGRLSHAARDAQQINSKTQAKSPSLSERRLSTQSQNRSNGGSAFSSLAGENPSAPNPSATRESTSSVVLYISGEESAQQVKLRANRLAKELPDKNLLILFLTDVDAAVAAIEETKPAFVVVDSIQTLESEALTGLSGSVGQVRYAALQLIRVAKQLQIPIVIVGHVTKEGMVAGPMVLSHMVDVVIFLEGEKTTGTRILRSLKNRFGPVDEVGIFSMEGEGMKEVTNPQQIFLDGKKNPVPGSVLTVTLEGTRAFLVEVQALVVFSKLPMPRRVASGIDPKRLELLLAVLQKHCNLPIATMDVFVNIAGGLTLKDRAADLAICLALFASLKNIPLSKTVAIAEVGLLGELRNVSMIEKRIKEAQKLGFESIITAKSNEYLIKVIKAIK